MNKEEALPCKWCKRKLKEEHFPVVHEVDGGLFYARCSNCNHYSPYEFPGTTEKTAIRNWNSLMKIQQGSNNAHKPLIGIDDIEEE